MSIARTRLPLGLTLAVVLVALLAAATCRADSPRPWREGDRVGDGWRLVGIEEHPEYQRYTFEKGGQKTGVEITFKRVDNDWSTRFHQIQPAPGESPPVDLLLSVKDGLVDFENGEGGPLVESIVSRGPDWVRAKIEEMEREQAISLAWHPQKSKKAGSLSERILANSTLVLQIIMLIAFALLVLRCRVLMRLARGVSRSEWAMLAFWIGVGVVLRLLGGIRVPGFTNFFGYAHGFSILRDVLVWDPLHADAHGMGFHALHGITTFLLPSREIVVVGIHFLMSIMCIPFIFFVYRFWFGGKTGAVWAAAVMAVLPVHVFFATTEIRLVPGLFFMLLSMCLVGVSIRDRHPLTLVTTALFAAIASQFYPTLMLIPLAVFLLVVSSRDGRSLLKMPWTWVSVGVFLLCWLGPAIWMLVLLADRQGSVLGQDFFLVFLKIDMLLTPAFGLVGKESYNVFLNHHFTPLVFPILALLGLIARSLSKKTFFTTISVFFLALLFTLPGMLPGRMNLARLQQGAIPFWVMLTGAGLAWITEGLQKVTRKPAWFGTILGGLMVVIPLLIWPGPIGKSFTLQLERRVFLEGLDHLDDGCKVVWSSTEKGINHDVPSYLAEEQGRNLGWGALRGINLTKVERLVSTGCVYYYRTSTCCGILPPEPPMSEENMLKPSWCEQVEAQLDLKEVFVRRLPNLPDDATEYHPECAVGFYKVHSVFSPD